MIQTAQFWLTLIAAVIVYWRLPKNLRDGFLSLASFAYLAYLDWSSVTALLGWTVVFYFGSARAAKKPDGIGRYIVRALIVGIIGYLAYFKYAPQFVSSAGADGFVVPLGISYFTFKLIHYSLEVSRGNITDRSFQRFACYVFLFPIFTAGPIERFDHFLSNRDETWRLQTSVEGATRIIHGLIKAFVFAHLIRPSRSISEVLAELPELGVCELWIFLARMFLYAYLDFSAYSDIAIGASRLFGIRILENFNFPVIASSIRDFWRRWHMTLAGWCQAYVYLPVIGYTRKPYLAVYATFVAMGLWHGADWNWVMWGLYHATGVSANLKWRQINLRKRWRFTGTAAWRIFCIVLTFAFVTGSYAFSGTAGRGSLAALRVFAKLFGIDIHG